MNFLQKIVDKKRAKQALAFYLDKKILEPGLSEDTICRLLLRNWIYRTSPMKDINTIDVYIGDLFKNKELTLVKACCWGIRQEFSRVYSFFENGGADLNRHAQILEDLEKRVQAIIKI